MLAPQKYGRSWIVLSLASAIAWTSPRAVAGTTGKIAGRVLDNAAKEALVSVNVLLTGTKFGAATDVDGYYTIIEIPPGSYDIEFRLIGYRPFTIRQVSVTADRT